MLRRALIALAVAALAVAAVYGTVHGYELWRAAKVAEGDAAGYGRCDRERKDERIEHAAEASREVAAARLEELARAAAVVEGERHARELAERRAALAAAAAASAASAARGLSGTVAALDARARSLGVPGAAACPRLFAQQRDEAIRARAALQACGERHQQLAADAERTLGDVTLQLDTALSYIRATGAPGAEQIPAMATGGLAPPAGPSP